MSAPPTTPEQRRQHRLRTVGLVLAVAAGFIVPLTTPTPARAASFPTWDQVEAARGSEQSKQAQISTLNGLIDQLQKKTQAAADRADAAGRTYQAAQDDLDQATAAHAKLAASTTAATTESEELGSTVGQVAAALTRPGGSGLGAGAILGQDDPDAFLQGLSMSSKIGEQVDGLYARASTAAKTAGALAAQARVAKTARTKLADAAQDALDDAVAASDAAAAAEASERENVSTMRAQLATLRDDRLSIEQGYEAGVRARAAAAAAAAKAAAEARARQQAAAAAAAASRPAASAPAPAAPAAGSTRPSGSGTASGWTRPITSYSFYQAYGYRIHPVYGDYRLHAGADFSAPCGTPLYATAAGTVTYAGPYGGYGNIIIIDHGGGITSAYAHVYATGIYVRTGQTVAAGTNIAGVGNAGVSTGCHLHFEIRNNGVATDPMAFLATRGVS
ncbi:MULTISPECIES: peptidoglycan DD-metalloendopeptidase family protein [unclassified Curtobacterium]|uniref:peptidoglycan DD-metalloendopeptidase family protein n=1 Tax=unclassified Curtobacterium TaxID=257496 RepID=UPI000FB7F2D9|nr:MULTISPECIES: peptidoglycan DD-metalloendopeptidase family protein [unclassified Curtobacterium]ROQ04951.1 peptidase M23-like protein [Curtobacterium sp. PhB171]ROQ22152.1 peptidase M23-like protein [Curtobacterium sp. PhB170]ROS33512.1 peptidase M23-like protein [Curtobacterium sp. PhB131]ROS64831.1 peptidase M23-like protein [Curtobacterium sp. PhB141]